MSKDAIKHANHRYDIYVSSPIDMSLNGLVIVIAIAKFYDSRAQLVVASESPSKTDREISPYYPNAISE